MRKILKRNKRLYSLFLSYVEGIYSFKSARNRYYNSEMAYNLSEYPSKILKLRNIHKGRRCFIIGNGPSLKATDLDYLKNEITFASNGIFNIFSETDWRPTYYMCQDGKVLSSVITRALKIPANILFFPYNSYGVRMPKRKNIIRYFDEWDIPDYDTFEFSEDCSIKIRNCYTVTYSLMQLAVYMGIKEIYLIGMDNKYSAVKANDGTIKNDNVKNHFGGSKDNYAVNIPLEGKMDAAYMFAKEFSDNHGIKIYNATRGGYLEIFERVNFDHIVKV